MCGVFFDLDFDGVIVIILEVCMMLDLWLVICFVMLLGGVNVDKVEEVLNCSVKYLCGQVLCCLIMKYMLDLRFVFDIWFDDDDCIGILLYFLEVVWDFLQDGEDEM